MRAKDCLAGPALIEDAASGDLDPEVDIDEAFRQLTELTPGGCHIEEGPSALLRAHRRANRATAACRVRRTTIGDDRSDDTESA